MSLSAGTRGFLTAAVTDRMSVRISFLADHRRQAGRVHLDGAPDISACGYRGTMRHRNDGNCKRGEADQTCRAQSLYCAPSGINLIAMNSDRQNGAIKRLRPTCWPIAT